MKLAARVTDHHVCPQTSPTPHIGGCVLAAANPRVRAEALPSARLADYALCSGPMDVVFEGASTVLVGGLPFAGVGDHTAHKGIIVMAAATVAVGGPTFSLPPNFIAKGDAAFQNALIRDLFLLSTLPSGRALIERLARSGKPITFVREGDPHNSFCSPSSPLASSLGIPTGSTISYNPDVGLKAFDAAGKPIDMPPQCVLAHEMVHAIDNAEGHHYDGTDPRPPASQPHIEEEEAAAIGTGSHSRDYPTENSVRSDMGLPRRDNHYGQNTPTPTGNRRPGGY